MDQFVLLGDSLTQQAFSPTLSFSFGAALSDAYVRRLDVVNRGLSGYNTTQALRVLPQTIPKPSQARIRFLMVFFGANDARIPDTPAGPDQSVAIDLFKQNLRSIVEHPCVRAHSDIRIILVTPPPIDERKCLAADRDRYPTLPPGMMRRTAQYTAQYAAGVQKVGQDLGVAVLDLWGAMIRRASPSSRGKEVCGSLGEPPSEVLQGFLLDGLHFNGEGYEVLFRELMGLIQRRWPAQMPERLPMVLPPWDEEDAWK